REFALLVTLGSERHQTARVLLLEALILGAVGIVIGACLAIPAAWRLLAWGVTTTGRSYVSGFQLPWLELGVLAVLGVMVALSGVIGPARTLYTQSIRDVLQPRFLNREFDQRDLNTSGFAWLLVPMVLASYLMVRPFLKDWLSVVHFFVFETAFVLLFALGALWWVRPLLRGMIGVSERALRRPFPLETLLTGRRMRLASRKFVFTVASVALVFSLLMGLNGITLSLKDEIWRWSMEALYPNTHFTRVTQIQTVLSQVVIDEIEQDGVAFYRLSPKVKGMLPFRLLHTADFNRLREREGESPLARDEVVITHTMAERFELKPGDSLILETREGSYSFRVKEVTDRYGYVPLSEQYVDMRTYALFSDEHPLFTDFRHRAMDFAIARFVQGSGRVPWDQVLKAAPHYQGRYRSGWLGYQQQAEIDRDFLIFDYILSITILLAMVGIVNSMLIQVHARERELSVYRVIGMSNFQIGRLLFVEGMVLGVISALIALVLGSALNWISVEFLDRFTLFSLRTVVSLRDLGLTLLGVVFVCGLAAIYPARVATRISSAESLHYE
ncbi:MAG: FtsX-like permease family protein, partial [Gammaproteobacteria bacterium]